MKKKIIVGNQKMNFNVSQAEFFISQIKDNINTQECDVVIMPNITALDRVGQLIEDTNISLGAQNVYFEDNGAFTGETSVEMLAALNVKYILVGHSERRKFMDETDEIVNKKVIKILQKGITPIICIGETLNERKNNETNEVLKKQIIKALKNVENTKNIIFAYEPIWAIGTGKTATSLQINETFKYIRNVISNILVQDISIIYGGSVKPSNIDEIINIDGVDGVLVGGSSLTNDFVAIVNFEEK